MVVAALALGAGLAVLPAPPVAAAACNGTSGVTVVVDARKLGGSLSIRCVPGDPPSGYSALVGSGFSVGFVPRQPGFVCTINGRPDPCNGAPPDAYWSYWVRKPGSNRWTYSTQGVASSDPRPGGAEGWVFGAGAQPPVIALPAAPATPRATSSTPPDAKAPAASPPRATRAGEAGTAARSPAPVAGDASTAAPPSATQAADVGPARSEDGVQVPAVAGLALIAVLAAAAGLIARSRARARGRT